VSWTTQVRAGCLIVVASGHADQVTRFPSLPLTTEFGSEDDEAFELDEDEDDLLDEDEMPDIELPGMVDEEETGGKRKRAGEDDKKEKRKKKAKLVRRPLSSLLLPPFADLVSFAVLPCSRSGVRTRTTRSSSTTAVPRTTSERRIDCMVLRSTNSSFWTCFSFKWEGSGKATSHQTGPARRKRGSRERWVRIARKMLGQW
jgi:hypothetical protein